MKYLLLIALVLAAQSSNLRVEEKDLGKCLEEAADVVRQCQDIITQATSSSPDFSRILQDASKVATDVSAMQHDCKFSGEIVEPAGDMAACIADAEDIVLKVKDIIEVATSGSPDFSKIMADVQAIMADAQKAKTDCGSSVEVGDCASDVADIVRAAQALITDVKNVNIAQAIADVSSLVSAAQHAATDCTHSMRVADLPTCISDVEAIAAVVQDIVSQVKSGKPNLAQIITDVQEIMADVKKAETDCNLSRVEVQGSCAADLKNVVADANALVKDIKGAHIVRALKDLKNLKADVKAAEADCGRSNDLPGCMQDVEAMIATLKDLIAQVESDKPDMAKILADVQEIVGEVQKAQTDCNLGESDDDMCQKETEAFHTDIKKLAESMKAQDQ